MREDIVGMLKNATERGGRPDKVAESLINSGYNAIEVQQALAYVTGGTLSSLSAPAQPISQTKPITPPIPAGMRSMYPQMPQAPTPAQQYQQLSKPLPVYGLSQNQNSGTGKVILLVFILILLIGGLISTIIFKEDILKLFG